PACGRETRKDAVLGEERSSRTNDRERVESMKRSALPDRPRLFGRFPNIGPDLPGGRVGFVWGDRRSWEVGAMLIDDAWVWRLWTTWTDVVGCTVEMRSGDSFDRSKSEFSRA